MADLEPPRSAFQTIYTYIFPILFVLLVVRILQNKFRRGLADIPGTTLAAYTGLWRLFDVYNGNAHYTAINLHRKHGPLVRIGPNHVSVGDPAEIGKIYSLKGGFTKTAFYPIQCISWQKKVQLNIFSIRDEAYHKEQRRPIANAYSLASLLVKEDAVDICTTLFMDKLGEFADLRKEVDLGAWLQYYAFDVIGEFSFAQRLGFLEKGGDVDGMIAAIEGMLVYASHCGQIPEAHPFLLGNPLFPILMPSMETWNQVLNFTLKAVNNVNQSVSLKRDGELNPEALEAKGDMLSRWSAVKMTNPERMSTRDIIVHLSTNVFAGSDTTAIAMRAIIYFLIKHPACMTKLVSEIDQADRAKKLSHPITYRESQAHLPYLEAVIKESIRLHPSVGLLLERHVPPEGANICGKHIHGGTIVGVNAWVTQRDPCVFDDPEAFIPERWTDSTPERLKQMEQAFFAFGAGSRSCLGKNISMMEMSKVIPQLLREFEIHLAGGDDREWKTKNIWFVQQTGLVCQLKKRTR